MLDIESINGSPVPMTQKSVGEADCLGKVLGERTGFRVSEMGETWLRTDAEIEAVEALSMTLECLREVHRDMYSWKWSIVAMHNAVQAFMVLALKGSDGLGVLKPKCAKKWLIAYRKGLPYPKEELESFMGLYTRSKQARYMKMYIHSKPFLSTAEIDEDMSRLNKLRNQFVHYCPMSWSLEVRGLPGIFRSALSYVEFLAIESGNLPQRAT